MFSLGTEVIDNKKKENKLMNRVKMMMDHSQGDKGLWLSRS
jgi:hypothetical protein